MRGSKIELEPHILPRLMPDKRIAAAVRIAKPKILKIAKQKFAKIFAEKSAQKARSCPSQGQMRQNYTLVEQRREFLILLSNFDKNIKMAITII